MSLGVSEDELFQAYQITSLYPQRWEDPGGSRQARRSVDFGSSTEEWSDPLGLRPTLPSSRIHEPDQINKINISSKSFDPKVFLNTVHPNASYAELSQGTNLLKQSIEQRSEALKVLVNENFDRFVSVKATKDSIFRSMTDPEDGPLSSAPNEGIQGLRASVVDANAQADAVFRPVLENYVKSMKLRNTLGVFQRSRFFFNLPGSLHEHVEAGNYEAALRDYKKGRYLLESRPGQLLPIQTDNNEGGKPTETQVAQQQRIFARVWDAVEEIMYHMQAKLLDILRDSKRSVDEQEKCIQVLLELDPLTDPVAVFLESQHAHIRHLLQHDFQQEDRVLRMARSKGQIPSYGKLDMALDLHHNLVLVRTSHDTKPSFDTVLGADVWKAIEEMVSHVCQTALQNIPIFWRVAKDHADGKFIKDPSLRSGIDKQSLAWAVECVQMWVKQLFDFFQLVSFRERQGRPLFSQLPSWVPDPSCSLMATQYLSQILLTITDTVKELRSLKIPGTSTQLNALLLDTRFQFIEVMCFLWLRDARHCYYMEDWMPNTQQPEITSYLFAFSVFNRWNAREGFFLADIRTRGKQESSENEVDAAFIDRLKTNFVNVLHVFLEGIATAAHASQDIPELQMTLHQHQGRALPPPRDRDTRILLTVSNLSHLRAQIIGAWVKQFEEAYHVNLVHEKQRLLDECSRLEGELLGDSVQRKGQLVKDIIRRGILESGIDWGALPKPTGVNAFIFRALLLLVQVHAQIRATVPALVSRMIVALVEIMADAILESYSKVHQFNMGGMLQATLEIEFVHQTMSFHVSPRAESTLKQVYETISHRYSTSASNRNDPSLQKELESVKATLIESRKATALEFLCFRKPKSDSKGKGSTK
ncbi:Exocyst complex component S5 [Malassezia equina]|uniref:Exocyst complex component SEC5 n=1 Tax=Malassezia equina TaxID=1381935 RepID=A0AAF0EE20_9BASI|nr:Exocyst complex component S5 [Malassezia equina]